jgi:hypothetical protein
MGYLDKGYVGGLASQYVTPLTQGDSASNMYFNPQQYNTGPNQLELSTVGSNFGPSVGNAKFMADTKNGFNILDVGANGIQGTDSFLGLDNNTWGGIGSGIEIGTGVLNTLTGMKQLGLQKDAFNFNKQMQEKQYGLAKDAYDRAVKRADSIGNQMQAGKVE